MRRVVVSAPVLVAVVGGVAAAAMVPAGPVAAADVAGKAVCTISDDRLTEISGMVATGSGYVVVNDSSDLESHRKIFFLSGKCKVTGAVSFPSRPRDPEDMALADDGTVWIADIGDNVDSPDRRSNIALWKLPKGADEPTIYRMKYPDGPHDAEALLLAGDGSPVIVTKELGKAGVYTPSTALAKGQTVELRKAGEFNPPKTTTSNPLAAAGRLTVTGGATAPDGSRVVLRTYADAFEFDVAGGNLVDAITKGTPKITPLPDEPRGESITYSTDGTSFLTVSETATDNTKPKILRYEPSAVTRTETGSTGAAGKSDTRSWLDKLTLTDITYLIGGVGVLGLLLVGVGVFGIMRARRRPPSDPAAPGGKGVPPAGGPSGEDERPTAMIPPVRQVPPGYYDPVEWDRTPAGGGREYRSGAPQDASRGTEYGSGGGPTTPPQGRRGGGVYGGKRGGGPSGSAGVVHGRSGSGAGAYGYDPSYGDPDPYARY